MASQPPLPPGFVLDGSPPAAGGPITVGNPRPPAPPSGFAPAGPGAVTPLIGGPQDPRATPPPTFGWRYRPDGSLEPVPGGPHDESAAGPNRDLDLARAELRNVVDAARRARELSRNGWFTTGVGSPIAGAIPGTSARDLQGILNTIGSNTAFDRLQKMREESPTGGALGAVSEIELQLLRDSIASLDAGQSDEAFQANMDRIIDRYASMYERLGGNPADIGRGPGVAPQILTGAVNEQADAAVDAINNPQPTGPRGELRFNDELPPDTNPLSEQQQRIYDAFLAANPNVTPDQLRAFGQRAFGLDIPNAEAIIAARGGGFAPASEAQLAPDIDQFRGAGREGLLPEGVDAFMRGAADVVTLGNVDHIRAARDTLLGNLGMEGQGYSTSFNQNLVNQGAIDDYDHENNFGARTAGQFAGSIVLPSRAPAAFASGGVRAGARQLGREGAIVGGGYSAGSSDGGIGDRVLAGVGGAALGAGTGYAGGRTLGALLAPRAAPVLPPRRAEAAVTAQSAADLGIDVMPADVGGPFVGRMTAGAAQGPVSAIPIVSRAQRVTAQSEAARDRIAGSVGNALDVENAGQTARAGAQATIRRTSQRGGQLYDQAERMSQGVQIRPVNAVNTLDGHIAELSQIPGGAEGLNTLRQLREQLAGNSFTVQGIRGMRTALRDQFAAQGLRGSDLERRVGQVVDAAANDIVTGLRSAGRADAAKLYQTADRYWRARLRTIDEHLDPILGSGRSGEEIIQALQRAGRGQTARLAGFIRSLPNEEAQHVRATLISQLGRQSAGQADASGQSFSLSTFLTHWNQLQPRARQEMFGREASEALQKLANVASGTRGAQRFQNFSNTAGGWTAQAAIAGLPIAAGSPMLFVASLATQYGIGRALASPRFARWLASVPANPAAIPAYARGLSKIARAEPAIAADIAGLQQRLIESFAQSPVRAAAEEEVDRR